MLLSQQDFSRRGSWWTAWRTALLASPAFQRAALRLPFTRPIARRRARRLFDLVAGFTYSQTLFACVELDLFERLRAGPADVHDLATTLDLPTEALARLVDAAAALGLVERLRDGRIVPGPDGAALLGNPGVSAMVAHHRHLYADLANPVALLRQPGGGRLADFWAYARGGDPAAVADYSALMAASLPPVAAQLLDAYDLSSHRRLLDIGGGEGVFLAEVRRRAPHLALGLFDLPAVTARAAARLGHGVKLNPGDFGHDPLPTGYDCITLVRVLHDHDDAPVRLLLARIREALPPGGALLIAEPMSGTPGAEPVGATYFGWYLRAMGTGRARTAGEIGDLLREAGFTRIRPLRTTLPLTAQAIVAKVSI